MDDKLKRVCNDFSKLNEEQQEYVLGIMQALVFAQNTQDQTNSSAAAASTAHKRNAQ
jgi:hypothetical protein